MNFKWKWVISTTRNCVVRNYGRLHYWTILIWKQRGTVNGKRYRHTLNAFLRPVAIHLRNHHELWFQQDGATCHTANETIDVLQGMFGNTIISRWAALTCLSRSPDLKERVYMNRAANLEDWRSTNLRHEIRAISPATLHSVMNNALIRARSCIAVEGQQHLRASSAVSWCKSPDSLFSMYVNRITIRFLKRVLLTYLWKSLYIRYHTPAFLKCRPTVSTIQG